MLTAAITSQISATSPAWAPERERAVARVAARLQYRQGAPDGQAHGAERQEHRRRAEPARRGGAARRRCRPRRRLRVPEHPCVHPPVDFLTDPLDQPFGHGRVVARAEITVRGRRGVDFFLHAHAATVPARRAGHIGASTRFPPPAGPRNPGTQEPQERGIMILSGYRSSAGTLGECQRSSTRRPRNAPGAWTAPGKPRAPRKPPNLLAVTSRACCSSWARSCSRDGTGSTSSASCTATSARPWPAWTCRSTCGSARGSSCCASPTASSAARTAGPRRRPGSPSGSGMCPASSRCASRCGWPRRRRRSPPPR